MKSAIAFLALAGLAAAQTWPMVTVDTSGNIVLQSTTKTKSFKLITTAVTAAGTAQASATAIPAGTSHATITASATTNGVALPSAEPGFRVTIVKATTTAAFNVYAASGDQINNAATTTAFAVAATDLLTTCEAFDTTNWLCESRNKLGGASGSVFVTTASKAPPSGTAPSRIGDLYVDTANKNIYFAQGVSNGNDYILLGKASAVATITRGTTKPGSGTTSTTGPKPAKIGDIYVDTANSNVYYARGATDGYDWVQMAGVFTTSATLSTVSAFMTAGSQVGKWAANSKIGDLVISSGAGPSFRVLLRTNYDTTGSIGITGSAGTFFRLLVSA